MGKPKAEIKSEGILRDKPNTRPGLAAKENREQRNRTHHFHFFRSMGSLAADSLQMGAFEKVQGVGQGVPRAERRGTMSYLQQIAIFAD